MARPDLTAACPPGLRAGPRPAAQLHQRGRLAFSPWLAASSVQPRGLFAERAVCRRLGREAGSTPDGWGRPRAREPTGPVQPAPRAWPSLCSPPVRSPGRATSPIRVPRVGLWLSHQSPQGRTAFSIRCPGQGFVLPVLVLALRAWGINHLSCLCHPCPGSVPSWWWFRWHMTLAQSGAGARCHVRQVGHLYLP